MQDFKKLTVWQRAHQFTLEVYRVTKRFPPDERYELTSQIRRATVSVCANIAEGCGRRRDTEFRQFLCVSMGSAKECEYFLLLARDLGYLGEPNYRMLDRTVNEVQRMLSPLIAKLQAPS